MSAISHYANITTRPQHECTSRIERLWDPLHRSGMDVLRPWTLVFDCHDHERTARSGHADKVANLVDLGQKCRPWSHARGRGCWPPDTLFSAGAVASWVVFLEWQGWYTGPQLHKFQSSTKPTNYIFLLCNHGWVSYSKLRSHSYYPSAVQCR